MPKASLTKRAQAVVDRVQQKLPAELRELARQVPVVICDWPDPAMLDDDLEPDILGLFVGDPHSAVPGMDNSVPAQIFLFVENILDEAEGDPARFDEEVRITYLHELGHFLGWDEDAVEAHGLE